MKQLFVFLFALLFVSPAVAGEYLTGEDGTLYYKEGGQLVRVMDTDELRPVRRTERRSTRRGSRDHEESFDLEKGLRVFRDTARDFRYSRGSADKIATGISGGLQFLVWNKLRKEGPARTRSDRYEDNYLDADEDFERLVGYHQMSRRGEVSSYIGEEYDEDELMVPVRNEACFPIEDFNGKMIQQCVTILVYAVNENDEPIRDIDGNIEYVVLKPHKKKQLPLLLRGGYRGKALVNSVEEYDDELAIILNGALSPWPSSDGGWVFRAKSCQP